MSGIYSVDGNLLNGLPLLSRFKSTQWIEAFRLRFRAFVEAFITNFLAKYYEQTVSVA